MIRWPIQTWSKTRATTIIALCSVLTFVVIPFFLLYFDTTKKQYLPLQDLTLTTAGRAVLEFAIFSTITSVPHCVTVLAKFIARYSYAIYLCHPLIYRIVLPYFDPSLKTTVYYFPMVMVTTVFVVWLFSKTPYIGKYLR